MVVEEANKLFFMVAKKQLPEKIVARIQQDKILGIRAGSDSIHKVIEVWALVVDGRVFVRSYQLKPGANPQFSMPWHFSGWTASPSPRDGVGNVKPLGV